MKYDLNTFKIMQNGSFIIKHRYIIVEVTNFCRLFANDYQNTTFLSLIIYFILC